jgi:hypothetical protein
MVWLPNDICMQAPSVNTMKPASRDNGRKIEKGAIRPWLWRSRLRRVGDPNATKMGLERTETCCGQE